MILAAIALPALLAAGPIHGPIQANDSSLLVRDRLWNQLRLNGDATGLARLLADDWLLTHSDGRTQTRAEYLEELRTRARTNQRIDNDSVVVRRYGATAVITGISVQSGISGGQPWEGRFRFTRIWVWRDSVWVMVASHSSRISR